MKLSHILILTGILLLSAVLLIFAAGTKSFWEDETYTSWIAQLEPAQREQTINQDIHPPAYMVAITWWGQRFGYEELELRLLSVIFAVLAVLFTFFLGRELFGIEAGLFAAGLLGLAPLFVMFAHNARYYALTMALAVLATLAMVKSTRRRGEWYLLLYILAGAGLLYSNYVAASVLLAANIWWLIHWLQKQERSIPRLLFWLLAQVVVILLYLPGMQGFINTLGRNPELVQVSGWITEVVKRVGYWGYVFVLGETLSPLNPLAWLGILTCLIIVGYALIRGAREVNIWLPVIFIVVILGVNLAVTFNATYQLVSPTWQNISYRTLYGLPFLAIWLATGLARMKPRLSLVFSALLLIVYAAGITNYFTGRQYLRPIYAVPWREIFQHIQADAAPGALVVCSHGDVACSYYSGKFGYHGYDAGDWSNLSDSTYPEIWWIQSNLSRVLDSQGGDQAVLGEIRARYATGNAYNYARQDPGIRKMKNLLIQQDDYEYRVNVFKYTNE